LAQKIRADLKKEIVTLGLKPGLAVILVGSDPASQLYVSLKEKAALEAGIAVYRFDYDAGADEATVIDKIKELNTDEGVNGILVQLPLPEKFNPNAVIAEINPDKDVDGFHPQNATALLSPGIAGPLALVEQIGIGVSGKRAVVIGNSAVFTQTFCDALRALHIRAEPTYPENTELFHEADILISAVGRPGFIKKEMIKPGAIVVDIGTTKVEGKTRGDVAAEAAETAGYLTPVPGGVGPMTVAMLLKNTVELCKRQTK